MSSKPNPGKKRTTARPSSRKGGMRRRSYRDKWAAVVPAPPLTDPTQLLGDFWPEDESVDDFLAEVRPHWYHTPDRTQ